MVRKTTVFFQNRRSEHFNPSCRYLEQQNLITSDFKAAITAPFTPRKDAGGARGYGYIA